MTKPGIGWRFPPTNGGSEDGFTNEGMEHFAGAKLDSLTREVIQNSLDARASGDEPVVVSFETVELRGRDLGALGLPDLRATVGKCLNRVDDTEEAAFQLKKMRSMLDGSPVSFLRITDSNTRGLEGRNWHALVKEKGRSLKQDQTAGGSFGIGKNAPFVVSGLRTVYYWSRFKGQSGAVVEKCQGKSVLMSHEGGEGPTQGTGFFGLVDGCREVTGSDIPRCLVDASGPRRQVGTHLWIAGFDNAGEWQWQVAQSVIVNFFCAIAREQLEVVIDVEDGTGAPGCEIRADNIDDWFTFLAELQDAGKMPDDGREALGDAHTFLRLIDSDEVKEKQDSLLGHCSLRIEVGEGLGSKVGLIRNTGMLITTRQMGLIRFRGLKSFMAVCLFEGEEGNEWLRKMENPKHDAFEPDRLRDEERQQGRRALQRVNRWIRDELKDAAGLEPVTNVSPIDELAKLLPDQPAMNDDAFGNSDSSKRHPGLGGDVVIRLKPVPPTKDPVGETNDDDEGSGNEEGTQGGGGGDGEGGGDGLGGEGDGKGGTGDKGGGKAVKPIELKDPRYIASAEDERVFHISFVPSEDAERAAIVVHEEGDSDVIQRPDLQVVLPDGGTEALKNHRMRLVAGKRGRLELRGKAAVRNRAWRVLAKAAKAGDPE